MASQKVKTVWFCRSCGNESPKWMGKCPACGEWNTMVEETVATGRKNSSVSMSVPGSGRKPMPLREIDSSVESRISLNNAELDRILGGGLVEGSLVLIGGEPGIGKSTLSLQIPLNCPQLKTVTLPTSIQNIGEHAFGFTYVEGEAYVPVEGFILQGLADAKGQEYATNHDLHYQVLTAQQLTQILDPPTTPKPQTTSILDKLLAFAKQYQMWLIIGGGVLLLVIILLIVAKKKKH